MRRFIWLKIRNLNLEADSIADNRIAACGFASAATRDFQSRTICFTKPKAAWLTLRDATNTILT
jgi:hypothetical protein